MQFPVTQDADEETKSTCPSDGSGVLLLDCPQATIYLRFPNDKELKVLHYLQFSKEKWLTLALLLLVTQCQFQWFQFSLKILDIR